MKNRPYFSVPLLAMQPRTLPKEMREKMPGPMATDKYGNLWINPDWCDKFTAQEQGEMMYHEVGHFVREHSDRAERLGGRHAFLQNKETGEIVTVFNLAADAELNDNLEQEGLSISDDWFTPRTMREELGIKEADDNMLCEAYYRMLIKYFEKECEKGGGGDWGECDGSGHWYAPGQAGASPSESDSGQGEGSIGDDPSGERSGSDGRSSQSSSENSRTPSLGKGNCGSVADGQSRPWEEQAREQLKSEGVDMSNEMSSTQKKLIRAKVAEDIRQECQKNRGTVPGHWERWAEAFLNPTIDWKSQLRMAVRNAFVNVSGNLNYSYAKLNRRRQGRILYPAMVEPVVNMACLIDTSGSMSGGDLAKALAEIKGMLDALHGKAPLQVFSGDTCMQTAQKVYSEQQVEMAGGGGTDMRSLIEWIVENAKPKPDILVNLTDGYSPFPEEPLYGTKVIVALIGDMSTSSHIPDWITLIEIKDIDGQYNR